MSHTRLMNIPALNILLMDFRQLKNIEMHAEEQDSLSFSLIR